MYWWLWLVLGLIFVGLEVLTPGGFYALFFGIGALAVGSLAGFGWSGPIWLQWLLFSAISLLSLLCFRPHLVRATRSKERPDPIHLGGGDRPAGGRSAAGCRGASGASRDDLDGSQRGSAAPGAGPALSGVTGGRAHAVDPRRMS